MTLTRKKQLSFCKVCDHKQFDLKNGTICSLTSQPADFEDDCPSFSGDRSKISDVVIEEVLLKQQEEQKMAFLNLFIPRNGYILTPVLVWINILLFAVMVFRGVSVINPDADILVEWGANFKPLTLDGDWWRLLSNVFIHIGVVHLLFNMLALIYIGVLLEPVIGKMRLLGAFVFTGIVGSVASLWWYDIVVSAGASGGIFGLYGVYIALLFTNLLEKGFRATMLSSMLMFVGYNLIMGLRGEVDNAAHIGGLVSGLIIGFSFYPALAKSEFRLWKSMLSVGVVLLVFAFLANTVVQLPNPVGRYNKLMEEFVNYEKTALKAFNLPENASDEVYRKSIDEDGIPNWFKCQALVSEMDSISGLPQHFKDRLPLLNKYLTYRIESYELMSQAIDDDAYWLKSRVYVYNQRIDMIIRKMNGEPISDAALEMPPVPVNQVPSRDFSNFGTESKLLFIVNDLPVDDISDINPDDVKSVTVLDAESSKKLYGAKGKNGAVVVSLK
jgi:rhomboid protease GluP